MKQPRQKKQRLDLFLGVRHPELSRAQIQSFIMQGFVRIGGTVCTKAGTPVAETDEIILDYTPPLYVSRAGIKLAHALEHFKIEVAGLVALDAGLSTGGFTDCLLQRGVAKVYGVDVGYGQVHEKIRSNPRVVVMERTNLRTMTCSDIQEQVDLVTLDLSFISVLKVMPAVDQFLKPGGYLIVLIKPQFEAERKDVGRGGIVRDPAVHERVIRLLCSGIEAHRYRCHGVSPSPITGGDGNQEFLAFFSKKLNF